MYGRVKTSEHKQEEKINSGHFELFCELAKENNLEKLVVLMESGANIDVRKGIFTPASFLAMQQEDKAVETLVNLGANLNEISYSYAYRGDGAKTHFYKEKGAETCFILRGHAHAGRHVEVDKLYNREATYQITLGYILGGFDSHVKNYAAKDQAFTNMNFVWQYKNKQTGHYQSTSLDYVAWGYVVAENYQKASLYEENSYAIAHAAAFIGNQSKVEECIQVGISWDILAEGSAFSARHGNVQSYLSNGAKWKAIARGYALGGHHSETLKCYVRDRTCLPLIAQGYVHGGHFANEKMALRTLTFIKDTDFRCQLMKEIKKEKYLSFDLMLLAAKVSEIESVMESKKITYDQSYAWNSEEFQGLFLQFIFSKASCFSADIVVLMISYCLPLNDSEIILLLDKMKFEKIFRKEVENSFIDFYKKSHGWVFFRDQRAWRFHKVCQKTESKEELVRLLCKEKEDMSRLSVEKDPYVEFVNRQCQRL